MSTMDEVTPKEAPGLLASLRWDVDQDIVNHDGEHVWLRPCINNGVRIGITDCCFYDYECEHHLEVRRTRAGR